MLMFMCVLTSLCSLLIRPSKVQAADGEWVTCFYSWCWYDRSKVYFEKDHAAEERAACPNYRQESSERLPSM